MISSRTFSWMSRRCARWHRSLLSSWNLSCRQRSTRRNSPITPWSDIIDRRPYTNPINGLRAYGCRKAEACPDCSGEGCYTCGGTRYVDCGRAYTLASVMNEALEYDERRKSAILAMDGTINFLASIRRFYGADAPTPGFRYAPAAVDLNVRDKIISMVTALDPDASDPFQSSQQISKMNAKALKLQSPQQEAKKSNAVELHPSSQEFQVISEMVRAYHPNFASLSDLRKF